MTTPGNGASSASGARPPHQKSAENRTSGARPYHHGNLAEALVNAGLDMVSEGGPDALVLREVARRVGVSPTAAYRHFAGQAGLHEAVTDAAMQRFANYLAAATSQPDDSAVAAGRVPLPRVEPGSPQERAIRRLEAIGRAYFDFAVTEPGLFRSFCVGMPVADPPGSHGTADADAPPTVSATDPAAMAVVPAFQVLVGALDDLVTTGVISSERRAAAIDVALWSAMHGLAVLCLDGPLSQLPREEKYRMLTAVTDVVFHGVAGPGN